MRRYIGATILLVLAIELLIITPLLFLTPTGTGVLKVLAPPPTPTPSPILTAQGTPPAIGASAAYVLDADTGHMLVNINGQKRLPMASTTKIMTALVTLKMANLNQIVTIKQDALDEARNNLGSTAGLVVGDHIRLKDLLYALLLPSGDDAAIAIADAVSGSPAKFVQAMNTYAHQLGLNQTHYINPDGLTYYVNANGKPDPNGKPVPGHYTTATDLAHLTRDALQNPLFAQIVQTQVYTLAATSAHAAYNWTTTDDLLKEYAGTLGVKTGYTVEAGYCLVFAATSARHHLIGVLLHDSDADANRRFTDAQKLLDWSFALPLKSPTTT